MRKGFTLIELLIVVLVLAIMTAIAVPLYRVTIEKGKATEIVKLTRNIYDSAERVAFRENKEGSEIVQFVDGNNQDILDIELRGILSNGNSTLNNGVDDEHPGPATFTMNKDWIKGERYSSAIGSYYFLVPRKDMDGMTEGNMYCFAQTGQEAEKICSGLSSSSEAAASANGYTMYKM